MESSDWAFKMFADAHGLSDAGTGDQAALTAGSSSADECRGMEKAISLGAASAARGIEQSSGSGGGGQPSPGKKVPVFDAQSESAKARFEENHKMESMELEVSGAIKLADTILDACKAISEDKLLQDMLSVLYSRRDALEKCASCSHEELETFKAEKQATAPSPQFAEIVGALELKAQALALTGNTAEELKAAVKTLEEKKGPLQVLVQATKRQGEIVKQARASKETKQRQVEEQRKKQDDKVASTKKEFTTRDKGAPDAKMRKRQHAGPSKLKLFDIDFGDTHPPIPCIDLGKEPFTSDEAAAFNWIRDHQNGEPYMCINGDMVADIKKNRQDAWQ